MSDYNYMSAPKLDDIVKDIVESSWIRTQKIINRINYFFEVPEQNIKIVTDEKEIIDLFKEKYASFNKFKNLLEIRDLNFPTVKNVENSLYITIPENYVLTNMIYYTLSGIKDVQKRIEEQITKTITHEYLHSVLEKKLPSTQEMILYMGKTNKGHPFFILNHEFFTHLFTYLFMKMSDSTYNVDWKWYLSDINIYGSFINSMTDKMDENQLLIFSSSLKSLSYLFAELVGETLWNKYGEESIDILIERIKNNETLKEIVDIGKNREAEILNKLKNVSNSAYDYLINTSFPIDYLDKILKEDLSKPIETFVSILDEIIK
ncbi:MAG: hypothetical protein ACP5G1_04460 [Nanopusillaceae archaeon]